MKHDILKVKFEATDEFSEGEIERTKLEKDISVINGHETHLEKLIDIFVQFMEDYGFQKKTIIEGLADFIEYEEQR